MLSNAETIIPKKGQWNNLLRWGCLYIGRNFTPIRGGVKVCFRCVSGVKFQVPGIRRGDGLGKQEQVEPAREAGL